MGKEITECPGFQKKAGPGEDAFECGFCGTRWAFFVEDPDVQTTEFDGPCPACIPDEEDLELPKSDQFGKTSI